MPNFMPMVYVLHTGISIQNERYIKRGTWHLTLRASRGEGGETGPGSPL